MTPDGSGDAAPLAKQRNGQKRGSRVEKTCKRKTMKAISHFLRTTILGGVLFLTPIVVLIVILARRSSSRAGP